MLLGGICMGLTASSVGKTLLSEGAFDRAASTLFVLAGGPNVGKSTVFNALTGLHQHTGNWTGKTVSTAVGRIHAKSGDILLADTPGTYSLRARSEEERVARELICFGGHDGVIVVCDALCLKRNLALVLQILEYTPRVSVCVNLLDEAEKKNVCYDLEALSEVLGVPVCGCSAKKKRGLEALMEKTQAYLALPQAPKEPCVRYAAPLEEAITCLTETLEALDVSEALPARFAAVRLLCDDEEMIRALEKYTACAFSSDPAVQETLQKQRERLEKQGFADSEDIADAVSTSFVQTAEALAQRACLSEGSAYSRADRRLDRLLMGRFSYPLLLLFLGFIFWLTVEGANVPSAFLSKHLLGFEPVLYSFLRACGLPVLLCDMLACGAYRVTAWVVSVMLPPMAIFFPLFTLLEDMGFLPRLAFDLDKCFHICRACGKQALTMCMGFGCNAAGVVGCRIIDSPRERLVAMLTNSFVPCNGRFPLFVTLLSLFFFAGSPWHTLGTAAALTGFILLGVAATLFASYLLTGTLLKGEASAFTLELPPYRMPQVGKVLVRSFLDRTLFVLGRAVLSAAPAGILIWLLGAVSLGDVTLLGHLTAFFDPFAHVFGMDGVILVAFLLALPANEIVLPVMVMAYMQSGGLYAIGDSALFSVLQANGWTPVTAVCVLLFSLMHFPCATTLLTIRRESGRVWWMVVAAVLPTVFGLAACFGVHTVAVLFGLK